MAADARHPKAGYIEHGLTSTQKRYLAWLEEQTGARVDVLSFKLAVALRDQFAKSEDNKAYLAKRKEERRAAAAAVEEVRRQREAAASADEPEPDSVSTAGEDESLFGDEPDVPAPRNPAFSDGSPRRHVAAGKPY